MQGEGQAALSESVVSGAPHTSCLEATLHQYPTRHAQILIGQLFQCSKDDI